MKPTKKPRPRRRSLGVWSNPILRCVLAGAFFLFLHAISFAQPEYRIKLQSRTFTPQPGIESALQESLMNQLNREEPRHVHLQLKKHPTIMERAELEKYGAKLLSYLGGYTWYATISDPRALSFTQPDSVKTMPALTTIRWIGEIKPEDRISPEVLTVQGLERIKTDDEKERYAIYFFEDVSMEKARDLLTQVGGEIQGESKLGKAFFVVLPSGVRNRLANEDPIMLIDFYPPPDIDHNDGSRTWTNSDVVHVAGITGDGVILGQWESGVPRNQHVDLTTARSHWEEAGTVKKHATHVAGTLIGRGTANANFTGHAPGNGTELHSYTTLGMGDEPDEMADAFFTHGVVAVNNSWGATTGWRLSGGAWVYNADQSEFGDYNGLCAAFDRLVRDSGLVIIFSSGNDRNDPGGGVETDAQPADWDQIPGAGTDSWNGFHTIPPYGTSKNVITVGAINDATNNMSTFSNWGPTDDGRIKPDVVAPGVNIVSCHYNDEDGNGVYDDYVPLADQYSGTSMAAPAVTGITALLIESYRDEYLEVPDSRLTPLPSTIKALLCQSADDMGNAGPDYQFGYGGIRADAARQLILDRRFREGVMLANNDQDIYNFSVSAGDPEIRFTLAWDDFPAGAGNPNPTIINDLDIVIQDPAGNFYTPWHLHVTAHDEAVNPAARNMHTVASTDDIPEADRDRWNNVEQIFIDPALTGGPLAAGNWRVIIEAHSLPEAPQRYSLVGNYALEGEIDVVQVLDRSGSMDGLAASSSTDTKIEVLRNAAAQFVEIMKPDIGNRLGLVQFNANVVDFAPTHEVDLSELTTTRATHLIDIVIPTISAGGRTSIGDGLQESITQFTGAAPMPEHDRVVLLVTDGKENEPDWIEDVKAALLANEVAVYPLGLGYGSGVDENKLTELADATGGSYRITADPLIFQRFFIEILAGAVDWSVLTSDDSDVSDLTDADEATAETDPSKVMISQDQMLATFTTYWLDRDHAVNFVLRGPSGKVINMTTDNSRIRNVSRPRYAFYQLQFPLEGDLASEWEGEWKMEVTPAVDDPVRYGLSVFADQGVTLDATLDKASIVTGEVLTVMAKLKKGDKLIPGANIRVYGDVPVQGSGNILHENQVNIQDLQGMIQGDTASLVTAKIQYLMDQLGGEIFGRKPTSFQLFDDGRHGDGAAEDGIYANQFSATQTQGSYTFRFVADKIPVANNLEVSREWTKSFFNEVNADPDYSGISKKLMIRTNPEDNSPQYSYDLTITPKDRFGNYMGPGRNLKVHFSDGNWRKLADNIDGTYMGNIRLTPQQAQSGIDVDVTIQDKPFASISLPPAFKPWQLSLHGGYTIPVGPMSNDYNSGLHLMADIGYQIKYNFGIMAMFGYNAFEAKDENVFEDTYWLNLSLNGKYTRPLPGRFDLQIHAGPGLYIPKSGVTKWGGNLGAAIDFEVNPIVSLEAGADFHSLFDSDDFRFMQYRGGILFKF
jgi:uncharacterized protein YegL